MLTTFFFLPTQATSHDLTSEDEDAPIPVPIRGIGGGWSKPQEPAKTAWRQASQGSSPELLPISNGFDFNPISHASSSSSQQSRMAPPKRPPDLGSGAISASSSSSSFLLPQYPNGVTSASSTISKNALPAQTKARLPGPMYLGPHLSDPSDSDSLPSSDAEEDFERFKMEMRVTKILEFHEAAAQADIALAVEIYKARKLRNGDKTEDAQRVADHQKRMMRLQEEKEEERKRIVKTERERVREELRKKGNGRAARNGIAPSTSKLAWLDSYNEQNVDLASNFDFAQILADAGIQQQQQFAEPDPLSYANNTLASHQHHLLQQQLLHQQQQLLLQQQQQQQPSSSSMPFPPKPIPQTATQKGVPASIYVSSSQFEQQQYGRQPQPGAFGWFDPEYDGDENREEQDDEEAEFEDEDEPEIPEALRQAFLKQQAQAAADLEASLNMPTPGSLNVSPPPPATTAPPSKAASTPSGWGVKNAAKAVVNGLGNSKALPTPAPAAAPTPSGWATKMVAATPLSSGWAKKAQQLPQLPEEPVNPPSQSPPKVDEPITPITPKARGPQPPATAAKGKKAPATAPANPSPAQAASSSSKPSPPPAKPAAAPAKVEKPAPAPPPPAPAPAGKKMNKKQRQQQQKKGGAAPPPKAPTPPPPTTEPESELPVEADAQEEEEHETPIISEAPQPAWVASQSTLRGLPGKSRMQLEATSIFGEDLASTPRPGSMFGFKRQQEKGEALPKASLLRRQMQMANVKQMGTPSELTTELPKAGDPSQLGFNGFNEREYWAPNAPSVAQPMSTNAAASQQVWNPPSISRSPPIEKTTSMPFNRLASSQRLRRSSDPVSPSPRGFELPDITNKMPTSTNTPKMSKAKKKANAKRVTIEEVSDEEGDGGPKEKLPLNSRTILEPKPSVPSGMFNNIFDYGVEDDEREDEMTSSSFAPTPSTAATSPDDIAPIDEGWFAAATKRLQQEKPAATADAKAKHVRWNPQARHNLFGEDSLPDTFEAGSAMGGMSIPGSFTRRTVNASRLGGQNQQQIDVNGSGMTIWEMGQQRAKAQAAAAADDKKGMGRDWMKAMSGAAGAAGGGNTAVGVGADASGRYANVAIENIKRGKPAAGGNLF